MTESRIFAVGDLHGHFDQWIRLHKQLIEDAKFDIRKDKLVFVGDMVDGGEQTKQVLDWVIVNQRAYPENIIALCGNHEDLLLDALVYNGRIYGSYDLWWGQGGRETYKSFLPEGMNSYEKAISQVKDHITVEYLDWMRKLPLFYETDRYFFVHAGLIPGMTIEQHKESLEKNDKDVREYMLWVRDSFIQSNYDWKKKIIFGHTCSHNPIVMDNKIGLDGMFHNNGYIFAVELPTERIFIESSFVGI